MKTNWKKIPSVTRENRWFYRREDGPVVLQDWLTNTWSATVNGSRSCTSANGFATSRKAMAWADKNWPKAQN
jgi:hypothetical protein